MVCDLWSVNVCEKRSKENVTKVYKKTNDDLVDALDAQLAKLAKQLKLDNRIGKLISLKTTSPISNTTLTKKIVDEIDTSIISSTWFNHWKNTSSVLKWFNALENKETLSFICFDVCDFYPSINKKFLSNSVGLRP